MPLQVEADRARAGGARGVPYRSQLPGARQTVRRATRAGWRRRRVRSRRGARRVRSDVQAARRRRARRPWVEVVMAAVAAARMVGTVEARAAVVRGA
eukprot:6808251-Prymnesium_polylepis.1